MTTLPKVDAVIIGLGAAGGVMAKELSTAGMKVVGLDAGNFHRTVDFQYHDELRFSTRGELVTPLKNDTPMQWRLSPTAAAAPLAAWTVSTGVGGGTQHYSAQSWRMLEYNFTEYSSTISRYGAGAIPNGANLVDWPITYNGLAPYYDKVDTEIGTSGKAGNIKGTIQSGGNPFEAPRNADYPNPPLIQTTPARMFSTAASALGYHPFPLPAAIISQPYNNRPGCNYCGFCTSYGCHVGAKSSTLVTMIPLAVNTGNFEIRTNCRVIKINNDGAKATSVTYIDPSGAQQEQPANLIVLSGYCWGNNRLLLLSNINKNGLVGKYFMAHDYQFVTGFFNQPLNVSAGPTASNSGIDDFNGDVFDHTSLGFIGGANISSLGGNTQAIGGVGFGLVPGAPSWGTDYKTYVKQNYNKNTALLAQLPPLPYEDNYLELDPNIKDQFGLPVLRITYGPHPHESTAAAFFQDKMAGILQQMGATKIAKGSTFFPPVFGDHDCGGTRMGSDPAKSVLNENLQSWDLPNLFVVGGSVFPNMFGDNPTETIEALSFYAADFITKEAKTGGSIAQYF